MTDPRHGDQLDRPYGDQETDYVVIGPEDPATLAQADDPAMQAVEEAGGGQAEGFELAEQQLIENAENAPEPELAADGFDLDDPATAVDEDDADTVAKDLSDLERTDEGTLAAPRDREALRASAEPGEADEVHSSEVTFDPQAGPDDPGQGPGIEFER
ncbi:hypothetical protein DVA67_003365 [Solirubrobacter sp. CPCC 204708]|uniref:DUF5709 domain-containing protein n=1 Tax=Solirubrobacter deserti TaxID=2282478 RepID=A0ABT4RMW0_9ACTN|nr:hypothetical protein [Solirubrobacter deserti]MBE2314998.1 hypothetical protein [Solirubrobacter deserti]MDA0139913.1 hypothetical protein [Solirubrobacter deserti]